MVSREARVQVRNGTAAWRQFRGARSRILRVAVVQPALSRATIRAANTGNSLATFLLGEVNSASVQISDQINTRAQYLALFAQDDWRVSDRLTLNYGLRYDIELPRYEVDDKLNSFDANKLNPVSRTPGVVTFAGLTASETRVFTTDINNIGPRVGFAYQLTNSGRTVLRGGTGVFYGQTCRCDDRRRGVDWVLDPGELRRGAGGDAERLPPSRWVPSLLACAPRRRIWRVRLRAAVHRWRSRSSSPIRKCPCRIRRI